MNFNILGFVQFILGLWFEVSSNLTTARRLCQLSQAILKNLRFLEPFSACLARMLSMLQGVLCLEWLWSHYQSAEISLSSILSRVMFNHLSRYYTLYPCHLIQSNIANLHHSSYSECLPVKARSALSSYTFDEDDVCLKYSLLTLLSSAIVLFLWCVWAQQQPSSLSNCRTVRVHVTRKLCESALQNHE